MHRGAGLVVLVWAAVAGAQAPGIEPGEADRIEAVQRRTWARAGAFTVTPFAAAGLDDPFLLRGGAGGRAAWWPSSLVGLSLEASAWGQTPSATARVAQRELRARMRPTGAGWFAAASLEIVGVDGKIAGFGGILPFELGLRAGAGAASATEDFSGAPALAFTGGLVARWLPSSFAGIETSFVVRSAALQRVIDGKVVDASDTVFGFELGVPFLLGAN